MPAYRLDSVAPSLTARIGAATPGGARRFAFAAARLACGVAGVHDRTALDVARGGLSAGPGMDELVRLWELERRLDAACDQGLDPDAAYPDAATLRLHDECAEAKAVASVIAALKPDAHDAARESAYEAWAAGCEPAALDALAAHLGAADADASS
ncbi:hypothetical protein [Intrasporangium flavum]|uniref:hypothetical protein n=1 Tax=Intrasporangium flavum TaxID=1428657 RepID=UPI00096F07EF|nr:hypothetical protein [Intrasporangium flavum]